jgi:hypothetical protein
MRLPTQEEFAQNPVWPMSTALLLLVTGPVAGFVWFASQWGNSGPQLEGIAQQIGVYLLEAHFLYSMLAIPFAAGLILFSIFRLMIIIYRRVKGS